MRLAGWVVGAVALVGAWVGDAPRVSADDLVLNVYNWSDYIGPNVIPGFTKETGAKVNYDVYDANETVEAKLAAGSSGYDIVVPTFVPFLARGIQAGLYAEIDHSKIKNWNNLNPDLLAMMTKYDPGNKYAVPWIAGTVGLGVNVQKVRERIPDANFGSLDLLLKPENAQKLASCGITILDSPSDVIPLLLHYLGRDTDSEKPDDLKAASDLLMKIRPYIRKFDSSGYINDLANGDACMSLGYSTDIVIASVRARDSGNGVKIEFHQPKEGTLEYIDSIAIPADAPHKELALKWIDYNLRPEVMADTANAVNARTGVKAADQFVRPDLLHDPQTYPTPEILQTLFTGPVASRSYDRLRSRAWTRIRSGT
jgi:putrescine transport system substrate-binding protein